MSGDWNFMFLFFVVTK